MSTTGWIATGGNAVGSWSGANPVAWTALQGPWHQVAGHGATVCLVRADRRMACSLYGGLPMGNEPGFD